MAEEVGSGYVSLVPSMRSFTRLLKAELKKSLAGVKGQGVEVPVVPKFDQKLLNESLKAQKKPLSVPVVLEPLNDKVSGDVGRVRVPVEIDREAFRRSLLGLSKDSRSTIHQRIEIDTDRDFARTQLANAAREAGSTAAGLFSNSFGVSLPVLIAGVIVAALSAPFIAGAIGAAALGGAALGSVFFGAFLLRGDKDLQKGVKTLFDEVKKTLTEAVQPLKQPFLESLGIIKDAFRDIAPDIKTFFATIGKSGGIQELARGFGNAIRSLSETGALKRLGESIGPVLKQIGMALPDIANAVSQFIITITKPEFIQMVGKILRLTADVIRFIGDTIGWLASMATAVKTTFTDIWNGLKILWNAVVGAITANMEKVKPLADLIGGFFAEIGRKLGLVPEKITGLVNNVKAVPGKIKTAIGDLGTLLLQAGKNVVQGLIDGIKSKFGALGNIASQMAGTIRNYLPFSPAKTGPLSGSGNPFHSGQVIAGDLAKGVESQLPTVSSAADQLAGAFGPGGPGAATAAPATAPQLTWADGATGDVVLDALRNLIRIRYGGDPTLAFGGR